MQNSAKEEVDKRQHQYVVALRTVVAVIKEDHDRLYSIEQINHVIRHCFNHIGETLERNSHTALKLRIRNFGVIAPVISKRCTNCKRGFVTVTKNEDNSRTRACANCNFTVTTQPNDEKASNTDKQ